MGKRAAIALALAMVLAQAEAGAQQPPPADAPPASPPPPADLPPASPPPPVDRPGRGGRQEPPPTQAAVAAGAPGYCQYVEGVAGAESAVLMAPNLFGSLGAINVGEAEGGQSGVAFGKPRPRVM